MRVATAFSKFAASHDLSSECSRANLSSSLYLYSHDKKRRYAYSEIWNPDTTLVLWIMMNPGTGDTEQRRRYTLEGCRVWSRGWGHGGFLLGNLTSRRTKLARELSPEDFQPEILNYQALKMLRSVAAEVVVAWGNSAGKSPALSGLHTLWEAHNASA
jgi:hypothetical protein